MSIVTGLLVFIVLWWLVFLMALPWGVKAAPDPSVDGHDAGAPARPRVMLKAVVTTGITFVLWGVAYVLIESDMLTFRGASY